MGERLLERRASHAELVEHQRTHQPWKWLPGHVHHELLDDEVAVAGVLPLRAGDATETHGRIPRRLPTLEHLRQRGERVLHTVAREELATRETCCMVEEPREGHPRRRVLVTRNVPARQLLVDRFVEREFPRVDEGKRTYCGHGLADRASEKQGPRRYGSRAAQLGGTLTLLPGGPKVPDHADAHTRNAVFLHHPPDIDAAFDGSSLGPCRDRVRSGRCRRGRDCQACRDD